MNPGRRLGDREADVSADVEDAGGERPDPFGLCHQRADGLLVASVRMHCRSAATRRFDRCHERGQIASATGCQHMQAFARKAPGDGCAEVVAGADDEGRLGHGGVLLLRGADGPGGRRRGPCLAAMPP